MSDGGPSYTPASGDQNPSLPAGWPTGQGFVQHCNALSTLDPRVLPNSFTVFDVALQARLIPKPRGISDEQLREVAKQHCRHITAPVHIHKLVDTVPGFPLPQFAASAGAQSRRTHALPLDLRPAGWGVCVAPARFAASLFTVANDALSACPMRRLPQRLARGDLHASIGGRDIDPIAILPLEVDHVRIRLAIHEINPDAEREPQVSQPPDQDVDDEIQAHFSDDGFFNIAVHAQDCPSFTIEASRLDTPHDLVQRASRRLLQARPHTTVQACWPIETPRDHEHSMHLILHFDAQRSEEHTMFLVDRRGLNPVGGNFAVFAGPNELTAFELHALLCQHSPCGIPPAHVLVNNVPLSELGTRRYVYPLIRLVSRHQCASAENLRERVCPATFTTSRILRHVPSFLALSHTYEAVLQRRFGALRRHEEGGTTSTTTTACPGPVTGYFRLSLPAPPQGPTCRPLPRIHVPPFGSRKSTSAWPRTRAMFSPPVSGDRTAWKPSCPKCADSCINRAAWQTVRTLPQPDRSFMAAGEFMSSCIPGVPMRPKDAGFLRRSGRLNLSP